jgi:hypothetical protein
MYLSGITALTTDQMKQSAPAIFSEQAIGNTVSKEYRHYSTSVFIAELEKLGWIPIEVRQIKAKDAKFMTYKRHLIRIYPAKKLSSDEFPSIVLINSHDGTCAYRIYAGVFRVVCTNGMIFGQTQYSVKLIHRWNPQDLVQAISYQIIENMTRIADDIHTMKHIVLTPQEQLRMAEFAIDLLNQDSYNQNRTVRSIPNESLLQRHRAEDQDNSLWVMYNVIHENSLKGFKYCDEKNGKKRSCRKITSIQRELWFNSNLYQYVYELYQSRK